MNIRDTQRDEYIFAERQKGRTFKDIGQELGITLERVRQVYERCCRDRRQQYFKTHPEAYREWLKAPNKEKLNFIPEEEKYPR